MKLKSQTSLMLVLLTILFAAHSNVRADAVSDWNEIALQTVLASTPPRPGPVPFLDMALVQIAVYDAVQAIDQRYRPYHAQIPGASGSPDAAAAKAAHDMLVHLFPGQTASLDNTYNQYLANHGLSPLDPGVAGGTAAALDIITLRANDGRFPVGQVPFVGGTNLYEWRPTESFIGAPPAPPSFAAMAAPWVGNVTPFTLKSGDQFRAGPPPPLTSREYTEAYNEIKAMGARFNSARTQDETNLALFWASNYAVLWNRVVQGIAADHVDNIGDSARLFALVNIAMGDAIITAWDTKNVYVSWRPLTAIRLGDDDTNPNTVGDPLWQPLINTPNYPDHSSGANNVTAAATRVLAMFFDTEDMPFVVRTTNPGSPVQSKTLNRFSDGQDEVVKARIWEGIHFRFADEVGRKQGRLVGQWVYGHSLKPIE